MQRKSTTSTTVSSTTTSVTTSTTSSTTATTSTTSAITTTATTTTTTTTTATTTTTSSNLPAQCSNYAIDSDSTRNVGYSSTSTCDSSVFGSGVWVRFISPAGTIIPTSAPAVSSCGTDAPGWFNGPYPSSAGTTTTGTLCYNWSGNTCMWSNSVQITHCSSFYVFLLINAPVCNLRYCAV